MQLLSCSNLCMIAKKRDMFLKWHASECVLPKWTCNLCVEFSPRVKTTWQQQRMLFIIHRALHESAHDKGTGFCRIIAPFSICTGGTLVSILYGALFVLYSVSCINRPSLLALSVAKHALQFQELLAWNQHSGFPKGHVDIHVSKDLWLTLLQVEMIHTCNNIWQ